MKSGGLAHLSHQHQLPRLTHPFYQTYLSSVAPIKPQQQPTTETNNHLQPIILATPSPQPNPWKYYDNKMFKSPYNCVISPLTQCQVANQQQKLGKESFVKHAAKIGSNSINISWNVLVRLVGNVRLLHTEISKSNLFREIIIQRLKWKGFIRQMCKINNERFTWAYILQIKQQQQQQQ